MNELADLTAAVTANTASIDAAVAALGTAPAGDATQLAALTVTLTADKSRLDAAVAAHATAGSS